MMMVQPWVHGIDARADLSIQAVGQFYHLTATLPGPTAKFVMIAAL